MIEHIASYFEGRREVAAVYLFGSHARSRSRPSSDVDIAVLLVAEDELTASNRRLQYIADLGRILRKEIHPVIMNVASEELLRQVFSRGRCIQVNDARQLIQFRAAAFAKIAEFAYYRAALQGGLIRKLKQEVSGG